ncbi:MAG: hypothetical protein P1V97_01595 [Planctomycetota bacterium]|nr:hypothetical protein [Planctomycetota bacterium]
MSDETKTEAATKKGLPKFLLFGCLPLFLLCVLAPIAFNMSAQSAVSQKVADLETALADFRAKQKYDRTPRFAPTIKGNAVDYYNGIEYVTMMRESWKTTPPKNLPELGELKAFVGKKGSDYDSASAVLGKLLSPEYRNGEVKDKTNKKYVLSDKDLKVVTAYMAMLKFVDDGLRCDRVEWNSDLEKGASMEIPNLLSIRFAAALMSHRARISKGSKKIDDSLRIVAFGEDQSRGLTLIQKMIAVSVMNMGYRSLQETMESPLSEADYQRILTFLLSVGAVDQATAMRSEYLAMSCTLAQVSGRQVNGEKLSEEDLFQLGDTGLPSMFFASDFFLNREWDIYIKMNEEFLLPMSEMNNAERVKKQEELVKFVEGSWSIFAKIVAPNYSDFAKQFLRAENAPKIVALTAAAHLHRLKTGKFPEGIDALAVYFPEKKLPLNTLPETPANFDYELKDGQLTISAPSDKDLIYRTWMPK